jgi:hypothetical protein
VRNTDRVTGDSWATVRLVRLSRPIVDNFPRPKVLDPLVRAGLFTDLALRGHIVSGAERLEVDTRPTGFAPADDLLRSVLGMPDRPLAWWLFNGQIGFSTVATYLVATGVWASKRFGRNYVDQDAESAAADLACVKQAFETGGEGHNPETVTVACLLQLLPAFGPEGGRAALRLAEHCGEASWLARDLVNELARERTRLDAGSPVVTNLRDLLTSPFNPLQL